MPTYEFQCPQCNKRFEVVRPRDKAGAPAKCPVDGASARRVFSAGGIVVPGGSSGAGESDWDDFGSSEGGTDWGEGGDFGMGKGGMGGGGDFGMGHSHGPGGHTH